MRVRANNASGGGGNVKSETLALDTTNPLTISTPFAPKHISLITSGGSKTCAYVWDADKDATKMWGCEGMNLIDGEQVVSYYREAQMMAITSSGFQIAKSSTDYGTSVTYVAIG